MDEIEALDQEAEQIADGINEVVLARLVKRMQEKGVVKYHALLPTCEYHILHRKRRKREAYISAFADRRNLAWNTAIGIIEREYQGTALYLSVLKLISYEQRLRDTDPCNGCIVCLADSLGVDLTTPNRHAPAVKKAVRRKARAVIADLSKAHTVDLREAFTELTDIKI